MNGARGDRFDLAKALLKLAVDWLLELGHGSVKLSTTRDTRAERF